MATPVPGAPLYRSPFDAVAETYDEIFTLSRIGRAQREAVTRELDRVFSPGQRILEINCGTGVDALHLASRGIEVIACDSAPQMIAVARRKESRAWLNVPPDFRVLATEEIGTLAEEKPRFDGVFSNFAGLNCVRDLSAVANDLRDLVKPRARLVICLFGRFCIWEVLWYVGHGRPGKVFRRLRSNKSMAQLAPGVTVEVHYPSVRKLIRIFRPHFRLVRWKGVGIAVPPSYLEPLARRFRRTFKTAARLDRYFERFPLIRAGADHVLVTFERLF
jgi:ubiquinone/menaquinone biosynthesis C-methylase UbiE